MILTSLMNRAAMLSPYALRTSKSSHNLKFVHQKRQIIHRPPSIDASDLNVQVDILKTHLFAFLLREKTDTALTFVR